MRDYEHYAPGALEEAFKRADGKTVPLTDRPGGKVIGSAVIHADGTVSTTITDPRMKKLLLADTREMYPGYSIGMVDPPEGMGC